MIRCFPVLFLFGFAVAVIAAVFMWYLFIDFLMVLSLLFVVWIIMYWVVSLFRGLVIVVVYHYFIDFHLLPDQLPRNFAIAFLFWILHLQLVLYFLVVERVVKTLPFLYCGDSREIFVELQGVAYFSPCRFGCFCSRCFYRDFFILALQ
eukprot:UN04472